MIRAGAAAGNAAAAVPSSPHRFRGEPAPATRRSCRTEAA